MHGPPDCAPKQALRLDQERSPITSSVSWLPPTRASCRQPFHFRSEPSGGFSVFHGANDGELQLASLDSSTSTHTRDTQRRPNDRSLCRALLQAWLATTSCPAGAHLTSVNAFRAGAAPHGHRQACCCWRERAHPIVVSRPKHQHALLTRSWRPIGWCRRREGAGTGPRIDAALLDPFRRIGKRDPSGPRRCSEMMPEWRSARRRGWFGNNRLR